MNIYDNIQLSESLIRVIKNLDIKIINICNTKKSPEIFTYENNIIIKDFKKYNFVRNIKANYKTSKIYFEINKTNYMDII